jgi:hypothetical protein
MNEKEIKFKNDIHNLVLRALRAGATVDSVETVMRIEFDELEKSRPFITAILEKDLGP